MIVYAQDGENRSAELTDIISTMEIDRRQDAGVALIMRRAIVIRARSPTAC